MSIWLYILMFLFLLGVMTVVAMSIMVGWKLTHPPRKPVDMKPEEFGIHAYENVTFPSREKEILLSGWYISASNNHHPSNRHTIIFSHGYSQNRQEPHLPALSLASRLIAAGYDVFMFDFRNAGLSGGSATTVGLHEQEDLQGAIDFVQLTYPTQRIGLVGFSMGAGTSLLVAGKDERVQAVVADSPFYSLEEYLKENLPHWTGLPSFPFNRVILTLMPLLLKAKPEQVQPCMGVSGFVPRPILFIHGTDDVTVPTGNSKRLYDLAKESTSELWLVPHAGHVRSYALCPDEYTERIVTFFQEKMVKETKKNPLIS